MSTDLAIVHSILTQLDQQMAEFGRGFSPEMRHALAAIDPAVGRVALTQNEVDLLYGMLLGALTIEDMFPDERAFTPELRAVLDAALAAFSRRISPDAHRAGLLATRKVARS